MGPNSREWAAETHIPARMPLTSRAVTVNSATAETTSRQFGHLAAIRSEFPTSCLPTMCPEPSGNTSHKPVSG